jgi:hypothetical protein
MNKHWIVFILFALLKTESVVVRFQSQSGVDATFVAWGLLLTPWFVRIDNDLG